MPQSDPWEEAAKNYKASGAQAAPHSSATSTSGDDDWKVWNQDGSNISTPQQGFFGSFGDQSALGQLGNIIRHPIDSASTVLDAAKRVVAPNQPAKMSDNPNPLISGIGRQVDSTAANLGEARDFAKQGNYMSALSRGISAIPLVGPALDKAEDQYATKNYGGEMGTLTGLTSNIVAPKLIEKGVNATANMAGGALKGAGFLSRLASATPEAQKIAATRALVPGSPAELLTRALKPSVAMPDFEQSLEKSLPSIASQNPIGVGGIANAAKQSANAEQAWYKGLTDPLRPFKVDASPIANAQMKSIPIMDQIEKPATLQGATLGRMKTVTVPAGEGTKMTMGGIVGANPGELGGGIVNKTADIANNYRRPLPLGVVDDVRQDSNAKLNAFFDKANGDKYAALSNPETARVAAVNDASRDLAYKNFARLNSAGRTDVPTLPGILSGPDAITPATIAGNQKLYGDLSDVATVAGKRATVAGRANPMSLQETLALKPSPMGVVDYLGQRMFKGLTNSDALSNAALDRYRSPDAFTLPNRMSTGAKIGNRLGKALDYAGSAIKRGPQ